jgi:hypothetical protein
MAERSQTSAFIRSSFRSVWSLEMLLLIKRERRPWPREELIATLRASDLVVLQAAEALVAAGLASVDDEGCVEYRPVSDDVHRLVETTERLYRTRPDAVRRLIVASASSRLAAFADAFRWKD